MRRRPVLLLVPAAALVLVLALAGIATASGHGSAKRASKGAVVTTRKTKLGAILVNAQGRSLYLFEKDKNGKSACSGACAKAWPPLMTTGKPSAAGGVNAKLLGTTKRSNGTQVTYNGHPLYTFFEDTKAGQTNGEGVSAFGATWDAVSPAGAMVKKKVGTATTPPANPIPQNNGGDGDADNNGGPSDGDGNI
jgi:predicted lipoprotein with Yx(FWY)xxD motif